jgi:lysosomal alpha-glucosidase
MLDLLYNKVKFSGIWLDMNELANFCDGPCDESTSTDSLSPNSNTKFDYTNDLPYTPGSDSIEAHTISLNATHYNNIS